MKRALATKLHPVILCLEDQASALSMRKMVLEKSGYTVVGASSGQEALNLLRSVHVDLVLSDHYLRGELGTSIAAAIKALKPNIPILILSGSADTLGEVEHMNGIISTTAGPTELLVSVARVLARKIHEFRNTKSLIHSKRPLSTRFSYQGEAFACASITRHSVFSFQEFLSAP